MANDCRLTTFDNPFDPFEQFTSWFMFDVEKGYNTCAHLARIVSTFNLPQNLTQKEIDEYDEKAIDMIIKLDPFNMYTKVRRNQENIPQMANT